ncbi:10291_t:CDS:2 [Acaulospora morrowiae]|uniref:10291_t:CDS:1 n=1 Tax=Acaulospora morrowiae TaxID=94023 RepID=A0A9N9B9R4_9GLOM|nr:10291_t:CDS:2 [Acaulospora morrowiae]
MPDAQIYIQDFTTHHEKASRPRSTVHKAPKIGNPTPLGLSSFALSVFILAFYNVGAFGVQVPNVIVGVSMFTGGVVQFAAGMWEFKVGNTFGGTGFGAFGGFWASFGAIYIPLFGIQDAFGVKTDLAGNFVAINSTVGDAVEQFHHSLAIYCLGWLIFTFIFTLACIRTNMAVLGAFVFLTASFLFEVIYHFYPSTTIFIKIAGVLGILCSLCVYYSLAGVLLTPDLSPVSLPLWDLSKKGN